MYLVHCSEIEVEKYKFISVNLLKAINLSVGEVGHPVAQNCGIPPQKPISTTLLRLVEQVVMKPGESF